jgi:hypothetical protein
MGSRNNGSAPHIRPVQGHRPGHCRWSKKWRFVPLLSDAGSHARGRGALVCDGFSVAMPIPPFHCPRPPAVEGVPRCLLVSGVGVLPWCARHVPIDIC